MANIITAGNSTNGGTAITTDTSGTLNIVTGSGSGVTAMSIDASGNVSGVIKSKTLVSSTTGTSIDFTDIPSTAKRITVMFNGVSLSGTDSLLIQIGSGSLSTSGYTSSSTAATSGSATSGVLSSSGFIVAINAASNVIYGSVTILNITGNTWISNHSMGLATAVCVNGGGVSPSLAGALDRVSVTRSGTNTFDAGSINILYE